MGSQAVAVAGHALRILHGHAGIVAATIRRKATTLGLDPARRRNADTTATYLINKKGAVRLTGGGARLPRGGVDEHGGVSASPSPSYKGHRFPVEIISRCVWLYHRFPLSLREVELMMAQRGVVVTAPSTSRTATAGMIVGRG